jgi:hypothetical protein
MLGKRNPMDLGAKSIHRVAMPESQLVLRMQSVGEEGPVPHIESLLHSPQPKRMNENEKNQRDRDMRPLIERGPLHNSGRVEIISSCTLRATGTVATQFVRGYVFNLITDWFGLLRCSSSSNEHTFWRQIKLFIMLFTIRTCTDEKKRPWSADIRLPPIRTGMPCISLPQLKL